MPNSIALQNRAKYSNMSDNPSNPYTTHTSSQTSPSASLAHHIELVVREYFDNLKEQQPTQLYELMLSQFEKPLISVVLEHTRGNQTKTAEILGLNRGTLRKKLKTHQLL